MWFFINSCIGDPIQRWDSICTIFIYILSTFPICINGQNETSLHVSNMLFHLRHFLFPENEENFTIKVSKAEGGKCLRCRRYTVQGESDLCSRCQDVISSQGWGISTASTVDYPVMKQNTFMLFSPVIYVCLC